MEPTPISNGKLSPTPDTQPIPIERPIDIPRPTIPPKVNLYNKEVQTMAVETVSAGPSEEEIQQRIQAEIESARIQREKDIEEENIQIAREIEDDVRGRSCEVKLGICLMALHRI